MVFDRFIFVQGARKINVNNDVSSVTKFFIYTC